MPSTMPARLDTKFESWGGFSKALDDTRIIPGRFSYDPASGAQLEVTEPMEQLRSNTFPAKAPPPITIYGQLVDGTFVTLENCVWKFGNFGAGMGSPTMYLVNEAFIGGHIISRQEFSVTRYSVELSSLLGWMSQLSPIGSKYVRSNEGSDGFDISCRRLTPIEVIVDEKGFSVEISHGMNTNSSLSSCTVLCNAFLTIRPKTEMPLSEAYAIAWQCQNLLSLLVGDELSTRSVEIIPSAAIPQNHPHPYQPIQQLIHLFGKQNQSDIPTPFMMLPYSELKDTFAMMVIKWLTRSDQSVLATNVFLRAGLTDTPAYNIKFVEMAKAAESYHRSLGIGFYMNTEEFEKLIVAFADGIPQGIQGEHRMSFKKRLKFANQYSFRKRIADLLNRIPENARLKIAVDKNKFVSKIAATRNYFTHFDHASEKEEKALEGWDAVVASERLRILVVANLLHDLGIEDEKLLAVLERNRDYRFYLNETLSL